jgi:mRNA interferase MazF
MLTSGDIVDLDLGIPSGKEAGFRHPAVIVTAQPILDNMPSVVQVVPLTSTARRFRSEVPVESDSESGLSHVSSAQCQHVRSVSTSRIHSILGSVGVVTLAAIREVVGTLLDIPRS